MVCKDRLPCLFNFRRERMLSVNHFIHLPEDFRDAALLVERREVELEAGEAAPVGARRERTGTCPGRVLKEPLRQAEERQQFRQQALGVLRREHIDVARHHRLELRHRHLPLIGPPFPEQHLPRPAPPRERRSIRHISPAPHMQRPRLQMLHRHKPLQPRLPRIAGLSAVLHHIPKANALPARAVEERQRDPVCVWNERRG